MAAEKPNLVHVEIFGQTYALNAGVDGGYVEQLAARVDAEMREVGKAAGAVDSLRVAVLRAASRLNTSEFGSDSPSGGIAGLFASTYRWP